MGKVCGLVLGSGFNVRVRARLRFRVKVRWPSLALPPCPTATG